MATVNFNDSIFVQEALQAFVAGLTPTNAFSRDFSGETNAKGDAIYVPRVDAITSTTFNQSYTVGGGTINTITVNLDQHRIAPMDLTDVQQLNSSAAKIDNMARQAGKSLAKMVLQDIWSVITTATFGAATVTTATANYNKDVLRTFRKALASNDVDMDMISWIGNVDCYDSLLSDDNIAHSNLYGGSEAIRDGNIPRVIGMDIYESNVIPLNSISLCAFATHPDAIAIAMRGFQDVVPSGAYEAFETATDDESGITMTYRRHYDPNVGKMYGNFECLFGYSAALTKGLVIATKP